MSKSKKIVIKFDSYGAPVIKKYKNCVQNDFYLSGSKLLARAKKLPKTQKIGTFTRLKRAFKYAFSKNDVDNRKKQAKNEAKHLSNGLAGWE